MELYKIKQELANGKRLIDLPLRVTFYARVSTDKDEQLNSLDNQIDHFKNYIKDNFNWTYVAGYIDEGISGSSTKGRIHFLKMIEDGKRGGFDLIVTKEVSRFSRNLADSIKYTQELLRYNVGIFFQSQNLNTFDPNSEFVLNMMSSMAQEETKRLSERVTWGLNKSINRDRVLGNDRILGYKKDKTKLVIIEEEAKLIRRMFELYATGKYGVYKLAKELSEEGYYNSLGKIYEYCTLKRMIENPKYKGYYRTNTVQTSDYRERKQIRTKKEDWVIRKCSPDIIPPIVSEELWNKCNDIINERSKSYNDRAKNKAIYKNRYTYSGLLWCEEHNVTFQRDSGSAKKNRPTWACGDYRRYHLKGCLSPLLVERDLDNIFKAITKAVFANKEKIIKEMLTTYSNVSVNVNYDKDLIILEDKIGSIEVKKDKLLDHNIDGRINNEEFTARNDKFNNEIVKIKSDIEKLKQEQHLFQKTESRIKEIEIKIREQFNFEDSIYDFVKQLADKVIVSKIDNNRRDIKLDIYLKLGNHLVYSNGIISTKDEHNNKLELCVNDKDDEFSFNYGGN